MKRHLTLAPVLALSCALLSPVPKLHAQSGEGAQKLEQLAKQLKLTPEQKLQLVPLLKAEAPRVEAIKSDPSLSKLQKLERLKAVHEQTDPQIRSILSP